MNNLVPTSLKSTTPAQNRRGNGPHSRSSDQPDPPGKNYIGGWRVDFSSGRFGSDPTTSYTLRLKLPHRGGQIAEIQLGTLPR